MIRRVGVSIALGLGLFVTGCTSPPRGSLLMGGTTIDEINLLTMPMALNLDAIPGADGFAVKIYAIDRAKPKSVAIPSGELEILIYDGVIPAGALATNTPLSRWRFAAEELPAFAQATSVGVVYAITPTWRERLPSREKITVTACYADKSGRRVCALPTTVTVSLPASFR